MVIPSSVQSKILLPLRDMSRPLTTPHVNRILIIVNTIILAVYGLSSLGILLSQIQTLCPFQPSYSWAFGFHYNGHTGSQASPEPSPLLQHRRLRSWNSLSSNHGFKEKKGSRSTITSVDYSDQKGVCPS